METDAGSPTFASRWCQRGFVYPTDGSAAAYLRVLERIIDEADIRVLISSTDANVQLLRQHRAQLEKRVRLALASEPALGIALNKERTLEFARQVGLQIPRGLLLRDEQDIPAALRDVGLPVIMKPVESWAWSNAQGVWTQERAGDNA